MDAISQVKAQINAFIPWMGYYSCPIPLMSQKRSLPRASIILLKHRNLIAQVFSLFIAQQAERREQKEKHREQRTERAQRTAVTVSSSSCVMRWSSSRINF